MKQYKLAIYDTDSEYVIRFMNYVNNRKEIPILVFAFTELKDLREYLKTNSIQALLISDKISEEVIISIKSEINLKNPVSIVKISESCINSNETIYKYNSINKSINTIIELLRKSNSIEYSNNQVVAVYSPIGRSGKTTYARKICSKEPMESLYLGFEEFSDCKDSGNGLDEILYYIKERNEDIVEKIYALAITNDMVIGIYSSDSYLDIKYLNYEDMVWFINKLRESSRYKTIVFDIGGAVFSTLEVLREFDKIYLTVMEGEREKNKQESFYKALDKMGLSSIKAKIELVLVVNK